MNPEQYEILFKSEESHWWFKALHSLVRSWISRKAIHKGSKVLDIGCGTGGLMKFLQKANLPVDIIGTDASEAALLFCRSGLFFNIAKGEVEKLPFKDGSFEYAICIDVIYHKNVNNPQQALKEISRVLKKDGELFLHVPAYNWLKSYHDEAVWTARRFNAPEVKSLVEDANFLIERVSYRCTLLFPLILLKRALNKLSNSDSNDTGDITSNSYLQNLVFDVVMKIENKILDIFNLPFGSSVFCTAKKR